MKTCTIDSCDKKHVARGLCATHYNQMHQPNRHPKVRVPCTICGLIVEKYKASRRPVCSYACRTILEFGPRKSKALVGPLPKPTRPREATPTMVKATRQGFAAGQCRWCETPFIQDLRTTGVTARFCSDRCGRTMHKRNRKARALRSGGVYTLGELVRIWLLFDRRCAYCEHPTNGLPEPDHVVALASGGSNSITNILPACRFCNADKRDLPLAGWNADRQRRGLAPVVTSWSDDDPRVMHLTSTTASKQ